MPSQPSSSLGQLRLHQLLVRQTLLVGLVTVGAETRRDSFHHLSSLTQDGDQPIAGSRIWPYYNRIMGLAGMPRGAEANL